jgi:chaperonin cofactor prefoldin
MSEFVGPSVSVLETRVGVVEREFADVYKRISDLERGLSAETSLRRELAETVGALKGRIEDLERAERIAAARNAELANRIATMELLGCKRCNTMNRGPRA